MNVLDLACGKGGDLLKWAEMKGRIKKLIFAGEATCTLFKTARPSNDVAVRAMQKPLTLSLLSSKSVFSQPFKKRLYE